MENNEKINNTKISTENENHRDNSSLLAKKKKKKKFEKPKLKNSAVKKTLILGDSIIKNIVGWRSN